MPAPLQVDWNLAKDLYFKGVLPSKIAPQVGVKLPTLSQRITREGWAVQKAELSKSVTEVMAERGKSWRYMAIDAVDRFMQALRSLPKARIDKLSRQDVQNLRDLVETGMRAYGMDRDQGHVRVQIGIFSGGRHSYNVPAKDGGQAQVIDAEATAA